MSDALTREQAIALAKHYLQLPGEKPLGYVSFSNSDLLDICRALVASPTPQPPVSGRAVEVARTVIAQCRHWDFTEDATVNAVATLIEQREATAWEEAAAYLHSLGDKARGLWEPYYHCAAMLREIADGHARQDTAA